MTYNKENSVNDHTFITEETADIVDIAGPGGEPTEAEKFANEVLRLEDEIDALHTEAVLLTDENDREIADHAETAKKLATAEKALLLMFDIWRDELGLSITDLDVSKLEEDELRMAIIAATERAQAAQRFAADRKAAEEEKVALMAAQAERDAQIAKDATVPGYEDVTD